MTDLTKQLLTQRGLAPQHFTGKHHILHECSTGAIFVVPQETAGVQYDYLMPFYVGKRYSIGMCRLFVTTIRSRSRTMATVLHDNYEETKRVGLKLGATVTGDNLVWVGGTNGCCK